MTSPSRSYHHGNLHDALIVAAAELIEERGSLDFSITDAAKRAGVSNAAPYRHFRDKDDLLDNVRHLAFLGLKERLQTRLQAPDIRLGSAEAIVAIGLTYLEYAREKRAFFSLMWEDRGQMVEVRKDIDSKMDGFFILVNAVEAYCKGSDDHDLNSCDTTTLHSSSITVATQLWALAHGMATLELNHMLDLFDRTATAEKLLSESTRALLGGLQLERNRGKSGAKVIVEGQEQAELPW